MYDRLITSTLAKSKKSLLLLGPRQVGKSTLLKSLGPDLSLNFAEPRTFREYVSRPERLGDELEAATANVKTILLDEVQRVPPILDVVQVLSDERPGRFRFLLSGSSARKLKRGHANLLPGRIQVHHLHPLTAAELGADFNPERAMAHGTLPGIYREADPVERSRDLTGYADTYIKEEIQAEALVRDVGAYGRMLELMAASSGRILNLNALCRDAGIRYETARRYLDVLLETLVAFEVPAWSGSDRAGLVAHPKIFLFDLGVRNALLRRPLDLPSEDEKGLLFEHLVAYELYRRLGTPWPEAKLSHFRNRHGSEVDLVLEIGREAWGIEVKAGRDSEGFKASGFAALAERIPKLKRRIVVFLGKKKQARGGVEFLPFADFQSELPPG
jgi:predicted AAA+ superfamily ATPase